MVAGIAHEINNPVTFIQGNLHHALLYFRDLESIIQLYEAEYPEPMASIIQQKAAIDFDFLKADLPSLLSSLQTGTERIQSIVASLKNFSHLDASGRRKVDIQAGLESTLALLHYRLSGESGQPEIAVMRDYDQSLPLVNCYGSQLNQVFLNLLTNAIDALNQVRSPVAIQRRVTVDTIEQYSHTVDGQSPTRIPQIIVRTACCNQDCVITIADNGPGIPPDILPQIFNPFFTTKPVGQGTGMGLAVSYQVIESHGGQLTCQSEPGKGTEFRITLPIAGRP